MSRLFSRLEQTYLVLRTKPPFSYKTLNTVMNNDGSMAVVLISCYILLDMAYHKLGSRVSGASRRLPHNSAFPANKDVI